MEYVYKLNLDFLLDKIKPEVISSDLLKLSNGPKLKVSSVGDFFDSETLEILDIRWNLCSYFQKTNGFKGSIHIDHPTDFYPAINVITGGDTLMEYWEYDTLKEAKKYTHGGEEDAYRLTAWECDKPADRSYNLTRGVYLINASIPHRATGYGNRHLFSIRSDENVDKNWEFIIQKFLSFLVPRDGIEPPTHRFSVCRSTN